MILPKFNTIPNLGLYLKVSGAAALLILGLAIWFGYQARARLLRPTISPSQLSANPFAYQDDNVEVQGAYIDFDFIQKPLCIPQGGNKPFADQEFSYKPYPAKWGLIQGVNILAVKIIDSNNQEVLEKPSFDYGEIKNLKGVIRLARTKDDCNLDLEYQSAYLEITPEEAELETRD